MGRDFRLLDPPAMVRDHQPGGATGASSRNTYCAAVGIEPPRLEAAQDRPDANCYSLPIVALLERGEPITLFALYQYGRLHGAVRLRWGFLDDRIPAPWVHRDEPMLHDLKNRAHALGVPLEIVAGTAPGWADPFDEADVQLARVGRSERA